MKRALNAFAYPNKTGEWVTVTTSRVYEDDDPVVKQFPGNFYDLQDELDQLRAPKK